MNKARNIHLIQAGSVLTYLAMVIVNALANILPINGIGTGAVSDAYPNLFAPTGLTFAIWGVIYLLLLFFVIYQTGLFRKLNEQQTEIVRQIGPWFILSSIANTVWIFCWHYRQIAWSVVLMLVILISLLIIITRFGKTRMTLADKIMLKLPFSVYAGWITVATIANITTLLVDIGWNGWGLAEDLWMIVALLAGLLIGTATIVVRQDVAYGLVLVWAYIGIAIKHLSAAGFDAQYPKVILTVFIALAVFVLAIFYVISQRYLSKRNQDN